MSKNPVHESRNEVDDVMAEWQDSVDLAIDGPAQKRYRCSKCGYNSTTRFVVEEHLNSHFGDFKAKVVVDVVEPETSALISKDDARYTPKKGRQNVQTTFNLLDTLVVIAQFPATPDKDYAYFVPEGDEPEVGDVILTSTSWDTFMPEDQKPDMVKLALDGKLARIIEVLDGGHPKATRFYMALVKVKRLKEQHQENQRLAIKAKEMADAYKKLDNMLQRQSRVDQYKRLADENPEAAKLLATIMQGGRKDVPHGIGQDKPDKDADKGKVIDHE